MRDDSKATITERIMCTTLFSSGESFTAATMRTELGNKEGVVGVANALSRMTESGQTTVRQKKRGGCAINFYSKHFALAQHWLSKPWVSTPTPTDDVPRYC